MSLLRIKAMDDFCGYNGIIRNGNDANYSFACIDKDKLPLLTHFFRKTVDNKIKEQAMFMGQTVKRSQTLKDYRPSVLEHTFIMSLQSGLKVRKMTQSETRTLELID